MYFCQETLQFINMVVNNYKNIFNGVIMFVIKSGFFMDEVNNELLFDALENNMIFKDNKINVSIKLDARSDFVFKHFDKMNSLLCHAAHLNVKQKIDNEI